MSYFVLALCYLFNNLGNVVFLLLPFELPYNVKNQFFKKFELIRGNSDVIFMFKCCQNMYICMVDVHGLTDVITNVLYQLSEVFSQS